MSTRNNFSFKIFALSFICFFICTNTIKAQIHSFEAQYVSGSDICKKYVEIKLFNGPLADTVNVSVLSFAWLGPSINIVPVLPNDTVIFIYSDYRVIGESTTSVSVFSNIINSNVGSTIDLILPAKYSIGEFCGETRVAIYDESTVNFVSTMIPLDFISPSGDTTTLLPYISNQGLYYYKGLNIYDISYTPKINQTWAQNNFVHQTSPILSQTFFWTDTIPPFNNDEANLLDDYPTINIAYVCDSLCNTIQIQTTNQGNGSLYQDVLYDYTDVNGITNTMMVNINEFRIFNYDAPFLFSVNDQWLLDNNLVQVSSDFTVDFQYPYSFYEMELICDNFTGVDYFSSSSLVTIPFVAPLESGEIQFTICNNICIDTLIDSELKINLSFPSFLVPDITSLNNPSLTNNTLIFYIDSLNTCEVFQIPFTFPGSTPIETILDFTVEISDLNQNETDLTNNIFTLQTPVLNSYDPNIKFSDKPEFINSNEKEKLTYNVHFQNEGNYLAMKVVVEDTISDNLDLSSFKLLESKYPVTYSINPINRLITFTFMNIFLAPKAQHEENSKGYFVYSIEEKENLSEETTIENTAYIYFDFNPAITTNTTKSTNNNLSVKGINDINVTIFPNPANDYLNIQTEGLISTTITDFTGKVIITSKNQKQINTSFLLEGIYFVKIETTKGEVTRKLIIRN